MKPVSASLPVISTSRSGPTAARIASHSAAVRWSFHRIAGRRTSPAPSSRTTPCIWPVSPTAATSARSRRSRPAAERIACDAPSHQRPGSCSLQSGCGTEAVGRRAEPAPCRLRRRGPPSSPWWRRRSRGRCATVRRSPGPVDPAQIAWLTTFSSISWRPERGAGRSRARRPSASRSSRVARRRGSPGRGRRPSRRSALRHAPRACRCSIRSRRDEQRPRQRVDAADVGVEQVARSDALAAQLGVEVEAAGA